MLQRGDDLQPLLLLVLQTPCCDRPAVCFAATAFVSAADTLLHGTCCIFWQSLCQNSIRNLCSSPWGTDCTNSLEARFLDTSAETRCLRRPMNINRLCQWLDWPCPHKRRDLPGLTLARDVLKHLRQDVWHSISLPFKTRTPWKHELYFMFEPFGLNLHLMNLHLLDFEPRPTKLDLLEWTTGPTRI